MVWLDDKKAYDKDNSVKMYKILGKVISSK